MNQPLKWMVDLGGAGVARFAVWPESWGVNFELLRPAESERGRKLDPSQVVTLRDTLTEVIDALQSVQSPERRPLTLEQCRESAKRAAREMSDQGGVLFIDVWNVTAANLAAIVSETKAAGLTLEQAEEQCDGKVLRLTFLPARKEASNA